MCLISPVRFIRQSFSPLSPLKLEKKLALPDKGLVLRACDIINHQ